jgi:hypothetical protein
MLIVAKQHRFDRADRARREGRARKLAQQHVRQLTIDCSCLQLCK